MGKDIFEPNLQGMISDQAVIDAQKRMVAAATKELPLLERLKPKNWPTKVKVAVTAAIAAGLTAGGVPKGLVDLLLQLIGG